MSAHPDPSAGKDEAWSQPWADLPHRPATGGEFRTTRWSLVLRAGGSDAQEAREAIGRLYELYWYPLYARVRRQGHGPEKSLDVVHDLFAALLEKNQLAWVAPDKGRFRSYLLTAVQHLLASEWQKMRTLKRGGGIPTLSLDATMAEERYQLEPKDNASPDRLFERQWALAVLQSVLVQLETECNAAGKGADFAVLKSFLPGSAETPTYTAAADQLQQSEGSLRVAVHRLRERYRDLLRATIRDTVDDPDEVDDEIRFLIQCLRNEN